MRIIDIDLTDVYISEIRAGFLRENEHTRLKLKLPIDLIGEYEYRISLQAGDADYLTDIIQAVEEKVVFDLSSTLTAVPELKVQVIAIDDNSSEVGKSKVVTLYFDVSLPEDGIQPPAPGNPPVPRGLPPGGTRGQYLGKASDNDFDGVWLDPPEPEEDISFAVIPVTVFDPLPSDAGTQDLREAFGGLDNCRKIGAAITDNQPIFVVHPIDNNESELCSVIASKLYGEPEYCEFELSFYSKAHDLIYNLGTTMPSTDEDPCSINITSNHSLDGLIVVNSYAELPYDITDGRMAFVAASSTEDTTYGSHLEATKVAYIKPLSVPSTPADGGNKAVSCIEIVKDGQNKAEFWFERVRQVTLFHYKIKVGGDSYHYVYFPDGAAETTGWYLYNKDLNEYDSIAFSNIRYLTNLYFDATQSLIQARSLTANNITAQIIRPEGHYYYDRTLSKWVFGCKNSPYTRRTEFEKAPVVGFKRDGQSIVNEDIVTLNSAQMNNLLEAYKTVDGFYSTIQLNKDVTLYRIEIPNQPEQQEGEEESTYTLGVYSFDASGVTIPDSNYITFELMLVVRDDPLTIVLQNNIKWIDDVLPDITRPSRTYLFAFRTFDKVTYYGNLQGSWDNSPSEEQGEQDAEEEE